MLRDVMFFFCNDLHANSYFFSLHEIQLNNLKTMDNVSLGEGPTKIKVIPGRS